MIIKNKPKIDILSHSRCKAVNHMSISDNDQIQPATTPLPSCSHANLMTPRLQQLPHRLPKKKIRLLISIEI